MTFTEFVYLNLEVYNFGPLSPTYPTCHSPVIQHFVSFVLLIAPLLFFLNSKLQISSRLSDVPYRVPSPWCRQCDWERSQREGVGRRAVVGVFLTSH